MSCRHVRQFSFGFDESNESYKVVKYHIEVEHGNARSVAKVFSLVDECWRNIQCFPMLYKFNCSPNTGVYLSGTINWLALRDYICSDE